MNIEEGYRIDKPDIFLPWGISLSDAVSRFGDHKVLAEKLTTGEEYLGAECVSLKGRSHDTDFKFKSASLGKGYLKEIICHFTDSFDPYFYERTLILI